ncbi:hypothetical protein Lalb_Chr21g0314451 [Lupinus albus]|uniref:Uncharacterized protein n=1 Tax=Lupinus albus TaxID=3870 RepID=A0A6A4NKS5_LUPAL|nr:hypothetical protein Lalb_Chr21g0314451 [Lupinus albus]
MSYAFLFTKIVELMRSILPPPSLLNNFNFFPLCFSTSAIKFLNLPSIVSL